MLHYRCDYCNFMYNIMDECISKAEHPGNYANISNIGSTEDVHISLDSNKSNRDDSLQLSDLQEKFTVQQKELERLEEQNVTYREKLIGVIRERDLNGDLLKNIRDEHKKEKDELERRIHESDIKLKAVQDCLSTQEAHYNVIIKDLSAKHNISVGQCQKLTDELQKSQGHENLNKLEEINNNLKINLEQLKLEKNELENKFRMSEKRVEVQEQSDLEEKLSEYTEEITRLQEGNNNLKAQLDEVKRWISILYVYLLPKSIYSKVFSFITNYHLGRLIFSTMYSICYRENIDLLSKLQDLNSKLMLEENAHATDKLELDNMKQIQNEVNRNRELLNNARSAQELADREREIAEKEAEECRKQAERMLHITEQLTQRNTKLAGEAEQVKEKNRRIEHSLVETEGALTRFQLKLAEKERDLDETRGLNDAEIKELKRALNEKIVKVQELNKRLLEEQNDHTAYKKKHTASMKELKHELSALKRQLETDISEGGSLAPPVMDSGPSTSSRSRASSLTSLDRVTEEDISTPHNISLGGPATITSIQQAMVDKIVVLQKKLERKSEKIDFLEEHVRQCLEELQKKTKVIQHYALREEASLLLPSDDQLFKSCEVVQVPLVKKGTSYSLMGSMFSSVGDKKSTQLVTEINSRLQAVLEDALLKNITLKASVDALGNEVSRLSRENRQLKLTQKVDDVKLHNLEWLFLCIPWLFEFFY
uniref:GRIP domain-containing protein n=1 Tax=Heterorhabditis bacteriophora TaxID=37862 RepID=A0A1I7XGG9_HETBA